VSSVFPVKVWALEQLVVANRLPILCTPDELMGEDSNVVAS
jgi:hypothetical protein